MAKPLRDSDDHAKWQSRLQYEVKKPVSSIGTLVLISLPASKFSGALWRGGGKRKESLQQRLSCHISADQCEVKTSANVNKH